MKLINKGFTLIELLVTVAIIGVLVTMGMISYRQANIKARDSRRAADIQQLRSALEIYRSTSSTSNYPILANCLSNNPLCWINLGTDASKIKDPINSGNFLYTYNYAGNNLYTLSYYSEITSSSVSFNQP